MARQNDIKKLGGLERTLVGVSRILMAAGGEVDFQREFPLPFTGGKRVLFCGWKGMLTSIEFLQAKGVATDQWGEKFIDTEPCMGPFGLPSELGDLHTDDPYSSSPSKTMQEKEPPLTVATPEVEASSTTTNSELDIVLDFDDDPETDDPILGVATHNKDSGSTSDIRESTDGPLAGMSEGQLEEYIFDNLLNKPASEDHANKFVAAAKALCNVPKTKYWNHTVCHFIESYGHESPTRNMPSLLNYIESAKSLPQYKEALDMLVAGAFPEVNCLDRIVKPIVRFKQPQ